MADLLMVRDPRRLSLVPATDVDRDRLARLPKGYPLEMHARFSRSGNLHRWYWMLLGKVGEAIGIDAEALHADLKFKARLIDRILGFHGSAMVVQLKSTSFPKMLDDEFDPYVTVAVDILFREHFPNIRAADQRRIIMDIAGRRPGLEAPPKLISR